MRSNLNFEAARANILPLVTGLFNDWDALGITKADFQLVFDNVPWNAEHRIRVERVLDGILFGELRRLGMPQIQVPSEYVALVISNCVGACNKKVACYWLADRRTIGRSSADLSTGDQTTVADTTPAQLFNLVFQLSQEDDTTAARSQFAVKLGLAIAKATDLVDTKKGKTN